MKRPVLFRSAMSWIPLLVLQSAVLPLAADPPSPAPPWSIGRPAAAGSGARFGLGLHYDFEQVNSFNFLDSDEQTALQWESSATGIQVPLSLSCFRLTGSICLFPTLTLEAASVDVTLDQIDSFVPGRSTSRKGSGDLFGAGLDVTTSLCGDCPWFAGGGYRFRTIPRLDLQGDALTGGEDRLSRDTHVASARLGYVLPGNRFAPYAGLRGQWRDVEIEKESRLESETIEGIVGVDARLWGSMFGRLEIMAGGQDKDCGVQLSLAYVGPRRTRPERVEPGDASNRTSPEETKERAREIADTITPRLEQILAAFREARKNLPVETAPTGQVYPRGAIAALLDDTERGLLEALPGNELTAMRDYVQDLFRQARVALGLLPGPQAALQLSAPVRLAALHSALLQPGQPASASLDKGATDSWLDRIERAIEKILAYSKDDDLLVDLCVKSVPKNRARFWMRPLSYDPPVPPSVNTNGRLPNIWRGLYSYSVERKGFKQVTSRLNLVDNSDSVLDCKLAALSAEDVALPCDVQPGGIEEECPR